MTPGPTLRAWAGDVTAQRRRDRLVADLRAKGLSLAEAVQFVEDGERELITLRKFGGQPTLAPIGGQS